MSGSTPAEEHPQTQGITEITIPELLDYLRNSLLNIEQQERDLQRQRNDAAVLIEQIDSALKQLSGARVQVQATAHKFGVVDYLKAPVTTEQKP
jgi:hypothetical protein